MRGLGGIERYGWEDSDEGEAKREGGHESVMDRGLKTGAVAEDIFLGKERALGSDRVRIREEEEGGRRGRREGEGWVKQAP